MNILIAFLLIAVLGLVLGTGLAVASKKFAVQKDEKAKQILDILPGANCGACGYPGCSGYASALSAGKAQNGLCTPGGAKTASLVAQILGMEDDTQGADEKQVAFVHCKGNSAITQRDYVYDGIEDCNAAYMLFKGDNTCKYSCLHLGSCIQVCPTDAISRDEQGMIQVDPQKCIGCRKCVLVCPTQVMKMIPLRATHAIACNNHDPGPVVRKICTVGCIACKICERKYPSSGCTVTNYLAAIDYDASMEQIGEAAQACPVSCIVQVPE